MNKEVKEIQTAFQMTNTLYLLQSIALVLLTNPHKPYDLTRFNQVSVHAKIQV